MRYTNRYFTLMRSHWQKLDLTASAKRNEQVRQAGRLKISIPVRSRSCHVPDGRTDGVTDYVFICLDGLDMDS